MKKDRAREAVKQIFRDLPPEAHPVVGSVHESFIRERLEESSQWSRTSFSDCVRKHARTRPMALAFDDGFLSLNWSELDELSDRYARLFLNLGLKRGERVGIRFPDGPVVHALYLATERAGLIAVGISARAGMKELEHLLTHTGASAFVSSFDDGGSRLTDIDRRIRNATSTVQHHISLDPNTGDIPWVDGSFPKWLPEIELISLPNDLALEPTDIFMINSTSGTTGLPKCVMHNQARWFFWVEELLKSAPISADDVMLSLVPAPYGFGIWSAHAVPIVLGIPVIMLRKYDSDSAIQLIENHQVTVMAAVTTQFIKMLHSQAMNAVDVSSLKFLYTGGEAIPSGRAREFETRTGAKILNFYGSNESGMLSYTTTNDTNSQRLKTAGQIVPSMNVQLLDPNNEEVIGEPGRSASAGPASSYGYYADAEANEELLTKDGQLLTGDLCTIDDDGYLRVVGRTSSFIIRGGKNISEVAVEEAVAAHPAVAHVAAIGVPDPVYGERVRAVVELHPGYDLHLEELKTFLEAQEVSKELWPEQLQVVEELPLSSGGKVAKAELRKNVTVE